MEKKTDDNERLVIESVRSELYRGKENKIQIQINSNEIKLDVILRVI